MSVPGCELCDSDGGAVVWRDAQWRVVRVADDSFPAFYRVICNAHVREFSDLSESERAQCMQRVTQVMHRLRDAGIQRAIILVANDNSPGRQFWLRSGWEELPAAIAMGKDVPAARPNQGSELGTQGLAE